jgi:hypothetical protein
MSSARYLASLLYQVNAAQLEMLALPVLAIFCILLSPLCPSSARCGSKRLRFCVRSSVPASHRDADSYTWCPHSRAAVVIW